MNAKPTRLNHRVHFIAHSSEGSEVRIDGWPETPYPSEILTTKHHLERPEVKEARD